MLHPSIRVIRDGRDGDVLVDELDAAEARGLQWRKIEPMFDARGTEVGVSLDFGAAGRVDIYGYSDEAP